MDKNPLSSIGRPLIAFESIESTNDIAKKLAELDFPEGTAIVANSQSKGRGRYGRKWTSPEGENIYLSIILRPKIKKRLIHLLSIVGAVAVAKTIKKFCKAQINVKWPNDVYVNCKKVSGILSELKVKRDNIEFVVMGIGVNLNSELTNFPQTLKKTSTSLSIATGKSLNKDVFLKNLLQNLQTFYRQIQNHETSKILSIANSLLYKKNQVVKFRSQNKTMKTTIKKINKNGSLKLKNSSGTRDYILGEIVN